jgi:hypothetical protein
MSQPPQILTDARSDSVPHVAPPAIRLVRAFKDATDATRGQSHPEDEVFEVESLLIAAACSFDALSRFHELWHQAVHGDTPAQLPGPEQTILDGYETWLDAADAIRERVHALKASGFESPQVGTFESCCGNARGIRDDARDRRAIDREAIRADRLEVLSRTVRPTQKDYDAVIRHPRGQSS